MKLFNPHSLLTKPKIINVESDTICDLYKIWKKLIEENNIKTDDFSCFATGYFLGTNSILREKYLTLKPKEEKIKM